MPGSAEALALTEAHRSAVLTLRERVAAQAASQWLALDLRDLDTSYGSWMRSTAALVEGSKRAGVTLADSYLAAFVAVETGTRPLPQAPDPEKYLSTSDGRSIERALLPPLFTVRGALAEGRGDALRLGMVRATRIVAEEVLDAPRRALGDLMGEEDRLDGWRRALGAIPCGACLALADGRVHPFGDPFRRHWHCRCLREPVVRGVPDRVPRPTGRDLFDSLTPAAQAALFHGRGGEDKAELVRSGAVPLEALATSCPHAVMPDQYTETSLGDLRALANRPENGPE